MSDQLPGTATPDVEIFDPPLCCPTGLCGPVFETSLVGLVFDRVRRFVDSRSAAGMADLAGSAGHAPDQPMSTAPAVPVSSPQPQKDASHD